MLLRPTTSLLWLILSVPMCIDVTMCMLMFLFYDSCAMLALYVSIKFLLIKYGCIITNWLYGIIGVYCRYVKMPQSGCVEHGLEYITFYVQEHIAHVGDLFWVPTGSRRAARGTRISETRLLAPFANSKIKALYTFMGLQKFVTIAVCSNKTYVSDENWNVLVDISANTEKPLTLLFTWFGER